MHWARCWAARPRACVRVSEPACGAPPQHRLQYARPSTHASQAAHPVPVGLELSCTPHCRWPLPMRTSSRMSAPCTFNPPLLTLLMPSILQRRPPPPAGNRAFSPLAASSAPSAASSPAHPPSPTWFLRTFNAWWQSSLKSTSRQPSHSRRHVRSRRTGVPGVWRLLRACCRPGNLPPKPRVCAPVLVGLPA